MPGMVRLRQRRGDFLSLPEIAELNIGHFLIGEAVFTGLSHTVMKCGPRWSVAAPGFRSNG
jgi:hypothetical protein